MKIDFSFCAALVVSATTLWARIAAHGFESALLSIAMEYGANGLKTGSRAIANVAGVVRPQRRVRIWR